MKVKNVWKSCWILALAFKSPCSWNPKLCATTGSKAWGSGFRLAAFLCGLLLGLEKPAAGLPGISVPDGAYAQTASAREKLRWTGPSGS